MLLAKCAAAGMESGLFRSKYIWDKKVHFESKCVWIWQRFWNVSIFHLAWIYVSQFLNCSIEHSANEGKNNESLHDRILSSSWLDAVLGEDIEGNLSYSVVAPLEEQVPGLSPSLGDGVPREDLILAPAQTVTCFSSSYEEVLSKADSFQAWPSSRKKAGLLPRSGIGVVEPLLKICFVCIAGVCSRQ